jgi:hypothetical protein
MFEFDVLALQYTSVIPKELRQTTEDVMPTGVAV